MQSYEQIRGHGPDFTVRYRLHGPEEGGREVTFQHLRCDFLYAGEDSFTHGIHMIHPEFLDQDGRPLQPGIAVPLQGQATMWILVPERRASVHQTRIKIGTRGYFMEGARKIGDLAVVRIDGLQRNPTA